MGTYTVRRPISNDPHLRSQGMVVSTHDSLNSARRGLDVQQRGAARQGGFSQDYIWDETIQDKIQDEDIIHDETPVSD